MVELMNWPPSRGENPCTCEPKLALGELTREDFEQPRTEIAKVECEAIAESLAMGLEAIVAGDVPADAQDVGEEEWKSRSRQERKLLSGSWSCDYQVEDVAALSLEQAVKLLCLGPARLHADEENAYVVPNEAELIAFKEFTDEAMLAFPGIVAEGRAAALVDPVQAALLGAFAIAHYAVRSALAQQDAQDRWYGYEPRELVVEISYPLEKSVRLRIPPMKRSYPSCAYCVETAEKHDGEEHERLEMSPGYLLWVVAKEYTRIYREHEHYGVWGHAIGDFVFEGLEVDEAGVVHLGIGS